MESVHVYCGRCIALTCRIRDRERRAQLETYAGGVQVTCLIVVEDSVGASRCRTEIVGRVVCKGGKGEGVGIKDGRCESPLVGLAKAGVLVFVCVLIGELSGVKGNEHVVSRLMNPQKTTPSRRWRQRMGLIIAPVIHRLVH